MTVRWRLAILFVQLALLAYATFLVTGRPYTGATWFAAALLALIINPQLLEPFYTRPGDVLGNSILGLLLYFTTTRSVAIAGWNVLFIVLVLLLLLSLMALLLGAGRSEGPFTGVARSATLITRAATSRVIWSAVFFLALIEAYSTTSTNFWLLAVVWAVISALGSVNWQATWGSLSGTSTVCRAEGMIGPSLLALTAPSLPPSGTPVRVIGGGSETSGLMVNRIRRSDDFWGQVHLDDHQHCERLVGGASLTLRQVGTPDISAVGIVLEASTDTRLDFLATRNLEVGQVVIVGEPDDPVFYQVRWAEIQHTSVRGGGHYTVRVHATQIGRLRRDTGRLVRHRWVPHPGGLVHTPRPILNATVPLPASALLLGELVGTAVPIYLDGDAVCQGHLAILGMTRMGKSTLAHRLARTLASARRVTILDQTGEWVSKRGLSVYAGPTDDTRVGLSVLEPPPGTVPADEALKYLRSIVRVAQEEYKVGTCLPRVLILDEAHQFVPEPTGMAFTSPGRDSASTFGLLMMQVRKYGITIILVSQRTAVVAKSALSQCENVVAFKNVDQTGLDYLEAVLGADARKALPTLAQGEALAFGPAISSEVTVGVVVSLD